MINNNGMLVKPERLYSQRNLSFADIEEGDTIPVIATNCNWKEEKIECMISLKVPNAFIRRENFSFPEVPLWTDKNQIHGAIKSHINKLIIAKVIKKFADGTIELDRKIVMQDTVNYLAANVGNTVSATIENIYNYGAFIDLGNGVKSLLHISNFSKCRYYDLENLFRVGDEVKVKLMRFDKEECKFMISRKEAYERQFLNSGSLQIVRVFSEVPEGVFVEFNPATSGIMDIPGDFNPYLKNGSYAICYIKKNTEKGFKARFISWFNES